MDDVQCLGIEDNLWNCIFDRWGQHNCCDFEDASVVCNDTNSLPDTPLAVRLVGGALEYEGRAEIYNENGAICSENFDGVDADMVCHELGYNGSLSTQSYLDQYTGKMYSALGMQ